MEQSRGRIISIKQNPLRATVEVDTAVFCSRCASGKGCGAGIFGSDRGPRRIEASVTGHPELREGDEVQLELAPQSILRAACVVYGVPLATAVVVAGMAWLAGVAEGTAVVAVIAGIVTGAFASRLWLRRDACLQQFTPVITGRPEEQE